MSAENDKVAYLNFFGPDCWSSISSPSRPKISIIHFEITYWAMVNKTI